jgi:hypothetical protein
MHQEFGQYTERDAAADFARYLHGQSTDNMLELRYTDRRRVHNLKYYTWVEQQGKTVEELDAQKDPEWWIKHQQLVPEMDAARGRIRENADYLRSVLQQQGRSTGASDTQIVPVMVGDAAKTVDLSAALEQAGIMATAIRPPTVPEGQSRIRLTLTALHTRRHVQQVIDALGWGAVVP